MLASVGRQNRAWLERYWDCGRQWTRFWQPAIEAAIRVAEAPHREPPFGGAALTSGSAGQDRSRLASAGIAAEVARHKAMTLTADQIAWLQRNRTLSGTCAAATAPVPAGGTSAQSPAQSPAPGGSPAPQPLAPPSASPPASAPTSPPGSPPASSPASSPPSGSADTKALPATDTDVFFALASPELTPDDQTALDSYAAKFIAAGSPDKVTVEAWASTDGQASFNATLSRKRAQAVADYLVSKGVPKDKISAKGSGPTDKFDKANLAANRRATLSPKPPSASAPAAPAGPPAPPIDLDPRSPANQKAIWDTIAQVDEANDWIRKHLKSNGLGPDPVDTSGDKALYNNKTTALTDVIDETVKAGKNAPIKAPDMVTPERVQRIVAELLLAASPGGGKVGGKSPLDVTVYLQYQIIPTTVHKPIGGGPETKDQPGIQLQLQVTSELHGKDASGVELSGTFTGTGFADSKNTEIQWQNVSVGGQAAWVQNFFKGNLQVSPQLQVTFGGSRAVMGQTQTIQWTPTGQITAAGQAQFKVPGFDGHLLVGLQAGVSVTGPAGAPATADRSYGVTFTWQF